MRKVVFLMLNSLLLISCATRYSELSVREIERNKIIDKFALQMQKKGMRPIGFGGGQREGKTTKISLTFQVDEVLGVDDTRRILVETTQAFLDCINSTPSFREYMCTYPFTPEQVKLSIHPNTPEPRKPVYVSIAGVYQGTIRYYTDHLDPRNLQLVTLKEESFEEAVEILRNQRTRGD